jgi:hypothetical protein
MLLNFAKFSYIFEYQDWKIFWNFRTKKKIKNLNLKHSQTSTFFSITILTA